MNLNMFGDQEPVRSVMTVTVLTAVTVLMLMVSSFMRKRKKGQPSAICQTSFGRRGATIVLALRNDDLPS